MVSDSRASLVEPRAAGVLLAWGLALVWATVGVALAMRYINDDAYITFRYSWNLAHGRGAVMNVGEYVEGYTNPLWMLIVAGWIRFVGSDSAPLFAKYLGTVLTVSAVGLVAWLAWSIALIDSRRPAQVWTRPPLRPPTDRAAFLAAAPLFMAANGAVWINATSGLETGLLVCLVCLAMGLDLDEIRVGRWRPGIVVWSLAALTRPEIVLVAPASRVFFMPARKAGRAAIRRTVSDAVLFAVAVGSVWIWRRWYYGEWMPNTYYAKIGGVASVTSPTYYWNFLSLTAGPFLLPLVLIPLVAVRGTRPWVIYSVGTLVVGSAIVFKEGGDGMPACRLLVPYVPCFVLLLAWGFEQVWFVIRRQGRAARAILSAVLLGVVLASAARAATMSGLCLNWINQRERGYREGHEALASRLKEDARPGDMVALMDIGIVGYRNPDLVILDTSGLTDRFIGKSPGRFLMKKYPTSYVFKQRRPRFLVICLQKSPRRVNGGLRCDVNTAWTTTERDLLADPALKRDYVYRQVYKHLIVGSGYYLALFERRPAPTTRTLPGATSR